MVYLLKERRLIEADAFTPGPPNAPVPAIINPLSLTPHPALSPGGEG